MFLLTWPVDLAVAAESVGLIGAVRWPQEFGQG
jgi:hypothetical protein